MAAVADRRFANAAGAASAALRTQIGPKVDPREAYIDQILLNVYGGQGQTNVWIDDLDLPGFVGRPTTGAVQQASIATPLETAPSHAASRHQIKLDGPVLLVDGRPLFPRCVQHRGESLQFLKALGFNSVHLDQPPTPELLAEAEQIGIWLVCPPPELQQYRAGDGSVAVRELTSQFDQVLAWDLGQGLSKRELDRTAELAKQLRMANAHQARPILCGPEAELRTYSRHVDLLVAQRYPLGSTLELSDYGVWLRERPRLARPGTSLWTTVQTQLSPAVRQQCELFAPGSGAQASLDDESIRLLVHTAIASGVRGITFESQSRLDGADGPTRMRALTLELMNLELELTEPWGAAGTLVTMANTSDPQLSAAVLQIDRGRLLLPIRTGPGSQFAPQLSATGPISFVAAGIPDASEVYELTCAALRPMRHKRVTGGMQITLDDFSSASLVVITSDPLVISTLTRRVAQIGQHAAELQRELAARTMLEVEETERRLQGQAPASRTNQLACRSPVVAGTGRQAVGQRHPARSAGRLAQSP